MLKFLRLSGNRSVVVIDIYFLESILGIHPAKSSLIFSLLKEFFFYNAMKTLISFSLRILILNQSK